MVGHGPLKPSILVRIQVPQLGVLKNNDARDLDWEGVGKPWVSELSLSRSQVSEFFFLSKFGASQNDMSASPTSSQY